MKLLRSNPVRRAFLKWRGRLHRLRLVSVIAPAGALLFVVLAILAIVSWRFGGRDGFLGADKSCAANQFSCGALLELITTLLAGAVAYVSFQYWRAYRVVRSPLRRGRKQPWTLVPTATEMKDIVGRDGICEIIEDDLCQKERRPQIVVAGVGEGKTAVLVRLTQMLLDRGAIPVSVRLRDATSSLDFVALAKQRFEQMVQPQILSEDEGDKVWRKFFNDGRIVILADGLEEAMVGADTREAAIRAGVKQAVDDHLPLVIASRPDEALENLKAALIRLEPIASDAAVRCIRAEQQPDSSLDVEELVERAGIADAPMFLHLARELHGEGRLEDLRCEDGELSLRIALLDRWFDKLLVERAEEHPRRDRRAALEALETMACQALAEHSHEVALARFDETVETPPRRVARVGHDMELVDWSEGRVRFRHSVMLAYLGAKRLPSMLENESADYLGRALKHPDRELLIALAICCRRAESDAFRMSIRTRLETAAAEKEGSEALELLAAAYQIDAMVEGDVNESLTDAAEKVWDAAKTETPLGDVKVDESKLRAIARMERAGGEATYKLLWQVCLTQDVYRIRLAAAQALATGGVEAHSAIAEQLGDDPGLPEELTGREGASRASRDAVRRASVLGWILPTLLDSSCPPDQPRDEELAARLRAEIDAFVAHAEDGMHLGVESSLAQGFKHAANRLPHRTADDVREFLIGQAERLLRASDWWYTHVCLLQALTLWTLGLPDGKRRDELVELVNAAARSEHHPFVRQTARLSRSALRPPRRRRGGVAQKSPSRFIWIDETGVVNRIGSRSAVPDPFSREGLWIPPAVGWHTLKWPARALVAEILLYLNLIEGGEIPSSGPDGAEEQRTTVSQAREGHRQAVARRGPELPRCIAKGRTREVGLLPARDRDSDGRGLCGAACGFKLCPYPRRDEQPFRGEMSETFCREQQRILRARVQRLTQGQYDGLIPLPRRKRRAGRLERFWAKMEDRVARIGI